MCRPWLFGVCAASAMALIGVAPYAIHHFGFALR